jgi:hypothetical protein
VSTFSRLFEQWCDDWAYLVVVLGTVGLSVLCSGLLALPIWLVADLMETDAFPEDSVTWGLTAWALSFVFFGPRFLRLCRPVLGDWGREEGRK